MVYRAAINKYADRERY